ncbi:hypothetical protein EBZ39_04430 [bacterium]|nr:hypothetical protein [bacterium]
MTYDTPNNARFKQHFKKIISDIPREVVSSRKLIKVLQINTQKDLRVFRDAFMDYFTEYFKHV